MKYLTVKELIVTLSEENPNAVVAIKKDYFINAMFNEAFIQPNIFIKKSPYVQTEFFLKYEIKENEKDNYIEICLLDNI